jgi:hypothetical protein
MLEVKEQRAWFVLANSALPTSDEKNRMFVSYYLAEREGFEPSLELSPH